MSALDALARLGRVADAGLDDAARRALRARGARLFTGPGPAWWAVGEARRIQLVAAGEVTPLRPDPDAEAFDGPKDPPAALAGPRR